MITLQHIAETEDSTMLGMNGGQPESPDGKRLVYGRKKSLEPKGENDTELWICDRDTLTGHRKVADLRCGNHNGPSATFVDNHRIVFRSSIDKVNSFSILDVDTGETVFGPIFGKESHRAENGKYPFSISAEFLDKNPTHPEIDECGIYTLDLSDGSITKIVPGQVILDIVKQAGYTPNAWTLSMSHVQLNPSATRVMMRLSVEECKVFGAQDCVDLTDGKTHFIADKPVHQLWFDDDTFMATRQYYNNGRIEMDTSRIQRFTVDGEVVETLGGIGNHIDGSPDRKWFTGDRAYPGYPADVLLYRRGEVEPALLIGNSDCQHTIWQLQIHPNPTFSMDGKRIYFNHPVSDTKTEAVFVDISELL